MKHHTYQLKCGHIRGLTGKTLSPGDTTACYMCQRAPRWDSPPPQRKIVKELPEVPYVQRRL